MMFWGTSFYRGQVVIPDSEGIVQGHRDHISGFQTAKGEVSDGGIDEKSDIQELFKQNLSTAFNQVQLSPKLATDKEVSYKFVASKVTHKILYARLGEFLSIKLSHSSKYHKISELQDEKPRLVLLRNDKSNKNLKIDSRICSIEKVLVERTILFVAFYLVIRRLVIIWTLRKLKIMRKWKTLKWLLKI